MLVADFLEVGDFDETEFGMQGDAARLIRIDAAENGVMTYFFGQFNELAEQQGSETFALMLVVKIHGILHAVAVGLSRMKAAERAPADDLSLLLGHDHGMFRAVRVKPIPPFLRGAGHGLIGAGAVLHVVVVNGVDGREVGKHGGACGCSHEGEVAVQQGERKRANDECRNPNDERGVVVPAGSVFKS